jgi:hypothetical protein
LRPVVAPATPRPAAVATAAQEDAEAMRRPGAVDVVVAAHRRRRFPKERLQALCRTRRRTIS